MKKEDVGHALKNAARILPGIGSYQDRESSRDADKALRIELSERLDQLLGRAEWLKTDLARKGAIKHIQRIEDVTRQLEKVSRLLEFAPRGYAPVFSRKQMDEEALDRIYGYDKALAGLVKEIEDAIMAMTGVGEIPSDEEIARVREMLSDLERRIDQREAFLNT